MSDRLPYETVKRFTEAKIPQDIEDSILDVYANYSIDHDMTTDDLPSFFNEVGVPPDLSKLVRNDELVIEGTNIVDFQELLRSTYNIFLYAKNEVVITGLWKRLLEESGRSSQFPNVTYMNHIISVKDLQKVANSVGFADQAALINMMSCATHGKRVFMTYLDFAEILGKLGLLKR